MHDLAELILAMPSDLFRRHDRRKRLLEKMRPNLHMLYSAAWNAGLTVNGWPARG